MAMLDSPGRRLSAFLVIGLMLIPTGSVTALTIEAGTAAPDFFVSALDGQRAIRLSDFRGRRVLIFTWASWSTCREQLPVWQKFYEAHRSQNFEILAVATDAQGPEVARRFTQGRWRNLSGRCGSILSLRIAPDLLRS